MTDELGKHTNHMKNCGNITQNSNNSYCTNIENSVYVPLLLDTDSNSISIQKDDIGYLKNVNFNLQSINPNYTVGQPVYIKTIRLSYDYIGLVNIIPTNTEVEINEQKVNLVPLSQYKVSNVIKWNIYLFNELQCNIMVQYIGDYENQTKIRIRVIEGNREFYVSNLKIFARGLIGEYNFEAIADISELIMINTNIISLNKFGIPNMRFSGNTWIDNVGEIILGEKFNAELTLDCIIPTSHYMEPIVSNMPGRFFADIDVSFRVNKKLYIHTKEENL